MTDEPRIQQLEDLIGRLIGDDPLTRSTEGLDDGCFWCGADTLWGSGFVGGYWADHEPDCVWVEAMRILDRDLGKHTVRSTPSPWR
jgi:hypothetical protein